MSDPSDEDPTRGADSGSGPAAKQPSSVTSSSGDGAPKRRHYAVWTRRGRGVVSDAERVKAGEILEREFGDYERRRKSLPREEPPQKLSKTIPVWTLGAKRPIDLVSFLDQIMRPFRYERIARTGYEDRNHIGYRALESPAGLEYFLCFATLGRPTYNMSIEAGLQHPPADAFAGEQELKYLPDAYREIFARLPPWYCQLRLGVPLDRTSAHGYSIDMTSITDAGLARRIEDELRATAFAAFAATFDIPTLFEASLRGEAPFPWNRGGDNGRIAVAAYLGRKLGRDAASLKSALVGHVNRFKAPPNTSAPSASEYLDQVLADADVALAAA